MINAPIEVPAKCLENSRGGGEGVQWARTGR